MSDGAGYGTDEPLDIAKLISKNDRTARLDLWLSDRAYRWNDDEILELV